MSEENANIWSRLEGIFRDFFDDDSIELTAEMTADDMEDWDSLAHIELLVEIERTFGVRFNTGEVASLSNVGEMADLVEKRVAEAGG